MQLTMLTTGSRRPSNIEKTIRLGDLSKYDHHILCPIGPARSVHARPKCLALETVCPAPPHLAAAGELARLLVHAAQSKSSSSSAHLTPKPRIGIPESRDLQALKPMSSVGEMLSTKYSWTPRPRADADRVPLGGVFRPLSSSGMGRN